MVAQDADAEWRRLLAPWLQALREGDLYADVPALPTADELECLWFTVFAPELCVNPTVIEAYELMELLARVDPFSAWIFLFECIAQPSVAAQWMRVLLSGMRTATTPALPRFRIDTNERSFDPLGFFAHSMRRLALQRRSDTTNADYNDVKALLLQRWSELHGGRAFDRETCGRVKLSLSCSIDGDLVDNDEIENIIVETVAIAFSHDGEDLGENSEDEEEYEPARGPFELDSVELHFGEAAEITMPVLDQLLALRRRGARVTTLSMSNIDSDSVLELLRFVASYLEPGEDDEDVDDKDRWRGLERLEIRPIAIDVDTVEMLAVAIAHSRSLRFVRVVPSVDSSGDVWWPWLAYALFSSQTSHNIPHVSLDVWDFDFNCAQAMRNVLCSTDQGQAAFQYRYGGYGNESGDTTINQVANKDPDRSLGSTIGVMVDPTACLIYGRHDASSSTIPLAISVNPDSYYRVVRDKPTEDFVEVIVPDRGVCWVDRDMVVDQCVIPPRSCHPIRHLTLKYVRDESLVATIELLKLIGRPIERVTLTDIGLPLGNKLFDALFACCPNLVRLDLEYVNIETWEWLWSQPSDRFKLEALAASSLTVQNQSSWKRLFETLGDTSSPLGQSLRRLRFNLRGGQESEPTPRLQLQDENLGHALTTLAKNSRLHHCEWLQCPSALFEKYNQLFQSHDGEAVAVEEGPLPPDETLACLSVLTPLNERTLSKKAKVLDYSSVAQYMLTPETVGSILAFLATPKQRVCRIHLESEFMAERLVLD